MKKNGFTLVEVLIVSVIVIILAMAMIGVFHSVGITNRGRDSRRKKDLARIKVAFEEYYNDKGCYPNPAQIGLASADSCDSSMFSPWLSPWPCDPKRIPYTIVVENTSCPKWFMAMTQLENPSDKDIPLDWSTYGDGYYLADGSLTAAMVNYGVSSDSVSWSDRVIPEACMTGMGCFSLLRNARDEMVCHSVGSSCNGDNCYVSAGCAGLCKVSCCLNGQVCSSGRHFVSPF